jgi:hypothetical protein
MTLSTSGYTVGNNEPLNHARILYAPITGAITADGTGGDLAANDYTFQRWALGSGSTSTWELNARNPVLVDTAFIAAHNLAGSTIQIQTNDSETGGSFVTRAIINPIDNSTIAVMFNNAGNLGFVPIELLDETGTSLLAEDGLPLLDEQKPIEPGTAYTVVRVRVVISNAANAQVGIIRFGHALQMQRPVFGGIQPIGLMRLVETRHSISETGQWLGRTIQRQARRTSMPWAHLNAAWYRANFEPFSLTLPQTSFGLIQNPAKMPESVAWCWTDETPQPENMGIRDLMSVSLNITGFLE